MTSMFLPQDVALAAARFSTSNFEKFFTRAKILKTMIEADFTTREIIIERGEHWRIVARGLGYSVTALNEAQILFKLHPEYDNLKSICEASAGEFGRARRFAKAISRSFKKRLA